MGLLAAVPTLGRMKRWFWILDALVVIVFVIIGREDHGFDSGIGDYVRVAAPFLVALVVSIVAFRAWRNPTDWRTGAFLAVGTVVLGMLLRRFVWDAGTARTFIVVTTAFLVAGMVGWRLVASVAGRILANRRPAAA
jgi:hypothetical protein